MGPSAKIAMKRRAGTANRTATVPSEIVHPRGGVSLVRSTIDGIASGGMTEKLLAGAGSDDGAP
jgi:hypothetical protein